MLRRHAHVEAVVAGQGHRAVLQRYAGTVACTCPSTSSQLGLGLDGRHTEYTTEPTGFMLHEWRDGFGLTSHVIPVGEYDSWLPPWAT